MKKRVLIVALLALGCVMGILILPRGSAPPPVAIDFLSFTNTGASQEAIFALSNPPPAAINLHSVRRITDLNKEDALGEHGTFHRAAREPWGLSYAVGVKTTNEPLQVVFGLQLRAVGARRLVEQVRELFGRLMGNEREFFTGRSFFVTNYIPAESIRQ